MPKRKLQRFEEIKSLPTVIHPVPFSSSNMHELAGKWRKAYFKNTNPIILELGCGRGEYSIELAKNFPEKNYIGIDVKGARLWRGAKTAFDEKIKNAAFIRTQISRIDLFFSEHEVDEIWITFPDPFLKTNRENRRLTSLLYLEKYKKMLKQEGVVHLKTDNLFFYKYTKQVATAMDAEILIAVEGLYKKERNFELSIQTTYEKRFLEQGLKIYYLSFRF